MFKGVLDDVRLFNTAVAPNFVSGLYSQVVAEAVASGARGVCGQGQALARLGPVVATCCDDDNETCDPATGTFPDRCTASCAALFLPWYEDCNHVVPAMFDETGAHNNLGGAFTEQIVMAPWRQFYADCEVHTVEGGHQATAGDACDLDAINVACADQGQLANQQLDVLCQTACVQTIQQHYDACSRDDANNAEFLSNIEPLMQMCAGDITTRRCYDHFTTVRTLSGRLGALSVTHSESFLYGVFVWACRALYSRKRRVPARAVRGGVRAKLLRARHLPRHGPAQRCVAARGQVPRLAHLDPQHLYEALGAR